MSHRVRAAALVTLLALGGPVVAQGPFRPGITPNRQPAFSPYLNLFRAGNSAAFNYYGLVRPEVNFRNSLIGLQGEVDANRQLITGTQAGGGQNGQLTTGHSAVFLNTGGYFLNLTGGGAGRGTAGPAAGGTAPGAGIPARGATQSTPSRGGRSSSR